MTAKYKKEDILNIHLTWNENSDDLDNVLFKQNKIFVKKLNCESIVNGTQGKIDINSLTNLGTTLLNDQNLNQCFYSLTLPSRECFCGAHAVALAVDNINHTIYYHDSHGEDMRKEMKDYLALLLPDYKIDINHSKQQQDVINPLVPEENDNSCALLTKYNLRDIWYKINGHPDKVCNFSSIEARKNAWSILKDIKKEEPKTSYKAKKPTFVIGVKKAPSKEDCEHIKQAEITDFKYRMYNEPNYAEMLQEAVQKAKSNHIAHCKQIMNHNRSW